MNTSTKTLWANVNGVWTDLHIRAYYDAIPVFVGGNFGIEVENGNYSYANTAYTKRAFQIANNLIKEPSIPAGYCDSIVSKEEIDFSAYTQIVVKNSFQNLVCNVSGYNGRGYLYVDFLRSGNTCYLHVGIASQKENFGHNTIDNIQAYCQPTANTIEISEITIE